MRTHRPSALLSRLAEMYLVRETLESAALSAAAHRATDAVLEQAVREDDSHTYHRQSRVFHLGLTGRQACCGCCTCSNRRGK
ncbi:hypothetical protein [Mycolicibacterium sp. F2034L]|uniref:hypothetical protein n=1 Tax=Mycolicibacterium sp. F2034L TaxID=2926422 RepID=UPI0035A8522C